MRGSRALLAALSDGRRVGAGAIGTNTVRSKEGLSRQHLAEEALGRVEVALGGQQEVDRIAVLVDGPVEVAPLTADLDVGLINPDRTAVRLAELAQPLLDQRRVGEYPAVQGAVINLDPAFQEQLLDIAVAERIAQVPGDGLNDERSLVVPTLEVGLGALLQLRGDDRQDHG